MIKRHVISDAVVKNLFDILINTPEGKRQFNTILAMLNINPNETEFSIEMRLAILENTAEVEPKVEEEQQLEPAT